MILSITKYAVKTAKYEKKTNVLINNTYYIIQYLKYNYCFLSFFFLCFISIKIEKYN